MAWKKLGCIFEPHGEFGFLNSHAQVPTALVMPDRIRVYFATRPQAGLSLPTFIDLDANDVTKVLSIHDRPILDVGAPGTFDADGVMPSCVVRTGDRVMLYYSGWSRLGGVAPYNNATGLAVSEDGGTTFRRLFQGPILDRTPDEPWSATSPTVIWDGTLWHMWYSSGSGWVNVDDKLEHEYQLKHATSVDGVRWQRDALPVIQSYNPHESQTRPAILRDGSGWRLWFSFRGSVAFRSTGQTYRLGHARSTDLTTWIRCDDQAGIDISPTGWDSQMLCYPDVVTVRGDTILFYNGNGFGATGFGAAILEPD